MKIVSRTTITQIGKDMQVRPRSPLWAIVNDGESDLILNNSYRLTPGDKFGVDASTIVPLGANFENETTFDVRFLTQVVIGDEGPEEKRKSAQLIETTFRQAK